MKYSLINFMTGMALCGLASADCQVGNAATNNDHEDNEKLCTSNGPGTYTFGMTTSDVCVPALSGGLAGCSGNVQYYIFDEGCNLLGLYEGTPSCGVPFTITENFLSQVLTVTAINTGAGAGSFTFDYGDGTYTINNNGCDCVDDSSGLEGAQACKCAFPQDGHFVGKRSAKFATGFPY